MRVLEIASLAPAPFGCMMLADLGADVVRIDRLSTTDSSEAMTPAVDPLGRGRRSVPLDLKADEGRTAVLRLVEGADVFVEGFRPGVAERLGVGPGVCLDINPRLVYARMTGWGQSGPMALRAGHDINYIAASGALDPIGRPGEPPTVPLNLVGDFGGGGMLLTAGVLAALYERNQSGLGQVIDVAMVDGSALLTASLQGMIASGNWLPERGANLLDGGAPFYDTYETADGRHVSVGAIERKFYAQLINGLGLVPSELPDQFDRSEWLELRQRIARAFKEHDRDRWGAVFAEIDACVFPVLSPSEAAHHAHATERGSFVTVDDVTQPAPTPRFSRTSTAVPQPSAAALMVGMRCGRGGWLRMRMAPLDPRRPKGPAISLYEDQRARSISSQRFESWQMRHRDRRPRSWICPSPRRERGSAGGCPSTERIWSSSANHRRSAPGPSWARSAAVVARRLR